ncbi:MAG: hypothetical protein WBA57_12500, partial [Elainellaceae cyanobacterium]
PASHQARHRERDYLRQIPVDFDLAPRRVIHHIQHHHPKAVVCCGMGESRKTLDLESTAVDEHIQRHSSVDLMWLSKGLEFTQISDDAGQFVCNRLYYRVLSYLHHHAPDIPCVFVHVPRLTLQNRAAIVQDFQVVIDRIERLASWAECSIAHV